MQRLDSLLLSALGVLMVHQIAYMSSSVLGYETSVAHGHLAVAWFGGSVLALAALGRAITRSLHRRNHTSLPAWALTGTIAGGYLLMEQFERALDGYSTLSLFSESVFWLGLLAAPVVAWVLHWSVRSLVELIEEVLYRQPARRSRTDDQLVVAPELAQRSPLVVSLDSVSRRGPPADLRT